MGYQVNMNPLLQSGINQANMMQGLGKTIGGTIGGIQQGAKDQRAMDTSDLIEKISFASPSMQSRMFEAALQDDRFDIDEADRDVYMNPKNQWAAIAKVRGVDYANDLFGDKDGSSSLPAETVAFNDLIKDFTPKEQALAKRVKAGLKGRAVSNAILTGIKEGTISEYSDAVSLIEGEKAGATEESKLEQQLEIKPKIVKAEEDVKVAAEERKQTQKQNIQRLSELTQSEKSRIATTKKAARFLKAFRSSAKSGASRTALSYLPGVFTDQAQFDEEFNAFAEVAARAKLKASGETRPTDADVEGMKRAIFGVGRDEQSNINLLEEFISDQNNSDIELDELRNAKRLGKLDVFNGVTERSEDDILAEYGVQ